MYEMQQLLLSSMDGKLLKFSLGDAGRILIWTFSPDSFAYDYSTIQSTFSDSGKVYFSPRLRAWWISSFAL